MKKNFFLLVKGEKCIIKKLLLFLLLTISFTFTMNSFTLKKLFFKYSKGEIKYMGEKCINQKFYKFPKVGDWEIVFYNHRQNIVFKTRVFNPLRKSYDLDTPYTPFKAKEEFLKESLFSVNIPSSIKFEKVSFYDLNNVKTLPFIPLERKMNESKNTFEIKKIIFTLRNVKRKKVSLKLKNINSAKIISHKKFIDNGNEIRRVDVVFIPVQYSKEEFESFHKSINFMLYNVCWGGWTDRRTFFDASPIKEFKRMFNFHYLDIANFPMDWQQETACMGDACKEWLDNFVKKFIPIAPDIYVFVVKDYPWSSMSSYWSIIIRKDSCGNVLLRAFSRSSIGGGLYNEFDTTDNCKDKEPKEIISAKNVTVFIDKDLIPWKHWIYDSTPLPTPNNLFYKNVVGAFEGAYDYKCHYYRPQEKCVLHGDLWDFCKVCREYFTITLLDNWLTPYTSATSNVTTGEEVIQPEDTPFLKFSISIDEVILSMFDTPNIVWLLDDKPIEGSDGKREISLNTSFLKAGKHTVKVAIVGEIKGTTGFIRKFYDNHYYYTFPEFEIGKGKFNRGR